MSAPPYMPLYVGDYLSDTTHLTCTEHGAYLLLLMAMWRAGGTLPNDDTRLARFSHCTRGQWERMRPVLIEFFTASDETLTHRRLTHEMTRHGAAVEQRRQAASNGGKAKALKDKERRLPDAMPKTCQPEPEPIEDTSEAKASSVFPSRLTKSNGFARFWEAYPRKIAKGAAEAAYAKALRRIEGPDPPGVLLLALERVKPTWRDPQFIPHPATWLNQTRWEDTPETVIPLDGLRTTRQPASQPSAKLIARHENYARAFAGAEIATRVRAER